VAVYVDGCFWHGCPQHATWPKSNENWWREKIQANIRRDRAADEALAAAGWLPLRVWEHDDTDAQAAMIASVVSERSPARGASL
jgi:DNA mismatch endonuclease (patch repair protein)